ncbi:hypothetical protein XELAEV_18000683mg [Xenopus laevis]|nr:hypothetical protein XELAEV_18000683mg [Xenopus laevis]
MDLKLLCSNSLCMPYIYVSQFIKMDMKAIFQDSYTVVMCGLGFSAPPPQIISQRGLGKQACGYKAGS